MKPGPELEIQCAWRGGACRRYRNKAGRSGPTNKISGKSKPNAFLSPGCTGTSPAQTLGAARGRGHQLWPLEVRLDHVQASRSPQWGDRVGHGRRRGRKEGRVYTGSPYPTMLQLGTPRSLRILNSNLTF